MCRMLMIREDQAFAMAPHLSQFAFMSQASPEFQGHGWGMAFRNQGRWHEHKSLKPIWECDLSPFGNCDFLIVHARSAFKNEGICLENNMPFSDGKTIFIFNGELHGVRLNVPGRIGAEKIFNFIKRLDRGNTTTAFQRAMKIIDQRSRYVRALNVLMTDGERIYLNSNFNEDPGYFTLHQRQGKGNAFCSQPLNGNWRPIANHTTMVV